MVQAIKYKGKIYRAVDMSASGAISGLDKEYTKIASQWNAQVDALKKMKKEVEKHLEEAAKRAEKVYKSIDKQDKALWDSFIAAWAKLYPQDAKSGWTQKKLAAARKENPQLLEMWKKWNDFHKKNAPASQKARDIRSSGNTEIGSDIVGLVLGYSGLNNMGAILDRLKIQTSISTIETL